MQRPTILFGLTMTLLLTACGGGKNVTDTDTDTATSTGTTGATGTNPTGTDGTGATETLGMSSAPTTGDDTTANTAADDTGTGTTGTTGNLTDAPTTGEPADLMMLCQALCEKNSACMESGPVGPCTADCVDDLGDLEEPCKSASDAFLVCLAAMTCEELVAFTDDDDPGPCAAQVDAQGEACSDQVCDVGIGTNQEGTECSYQISCADEPISEMNCMAGSCQCIKGGMEANSCPAPDDICQTLELGALAQECCGF